MQTSLPLPTSDVDSTGVSDVMVTVDLAEEPTPNQFHATVVVHSSSDQSPSLTFDEALDVISTSTSQLSVSEEPIASVVQELSVVDAEMVDQDSTPVVASSNMTPSVASDSASVAEVLVASASDPRPRAPFGRRPGSRSQASAPDVGSTPFASGSQHGSNSRPNNELTHNAVMDALFRRHNKAEAAASAARRQQQEANTRTSSSSSNQPSGSSSSMSVSVPNLTSTMEQTVSLLETFAMVARRNLGNNSGGVMSSVTSSNNNPCSSLVRLALSSNSPGAFPVS